MAEVASGREIGYVNNAGQAVAPPTTCGLENRRSAILVR
jgi:hypothetical protein